MSLRLWSAVLVLGAVSWLPAQSYEFTFDSDSSAFEGRMICRMDLLGWLVGERNQASESDGSLTLSEKVGKGTARPAKIGVQGALDLQAVGRSSLAGSFCFEASANGYTVSDFQLDFLRGSTWGLLGSLSVRHGAFLTHSPASRLQAGQFQLKVDHTSLDTWSFAQSGPSHTSVRQIGPGRWWVSAQVPGSMSLGVPVFGEAPVLVDGVVYCFSGVVEVDDDEATFSGSQASVLAIKGGVCGELPEIQVPSGSIQGSQAGLLLWLDSGTVAAKVEGRSQLRATATAEH
ncbi:MAG: hypothetical protein KF884_04470 [Fimbriimonadaceae bacterium]|nr:hypothetical protein [Fimbriimonadaceae bacterium]QYK59344.1 MAG: hypothetical protein KF884_04470 [Fimbriimonadaceae bacterium]